MRRPYQILLPLLSLFLVRVDLTDLWNIKLVVTDIQLLDADTAIVFYKNRKLKVRFDKVDAPEKRQPFWDKKGDAGMAALRCAEKVLNKQSYVLRIFRQDIYGRILGELDDLNIRLVEEGCVSLYPFAKFSSKAEKWMFIRALMMARRERRGLWARGGYKQPKLWRKQCNLRRRRLQRVKS